MHTPADSIVAYLHAKDHNRPHRMAQAFATGASLRMEVRRGAITFPPLSSGREAITDTLVRRFAQTYENVHTFCLAAPPAAHDASYRCAWLVAMSEKQGHAVRVGCGQYDWRFDPASGLADDLAIRIDAMVSLPTDTLTGVMGWVTRLPYPWCEAGQALRTAPRLNGLDAVLDSLAGSRVTSGVAA